jgi:hydroxyethylthiazole kinase-like uncharacterized protein yjeF
MAVADRRAAEGGVPVEDLMYVAGRSVAYVVRERFPDAKEVLVLCGPGNNGGDGYVAAQELSSDRSVTVLEVTSSPGTPAARWARDNLLKAGVTPQPLVFEVVARWLVAADPDEAVVVDALLGCGLRRPLDGVLLGVVRMLNAEDVPVVSVDVPTGVDADRPVPPGEHLRADMTVQLAGPKVASAFHPARAAFAGARPGRPGGIFVAEIGIPAEVLDEVSSTLWLEADDVAAWLPARQPDAHKYTAGTVTVVGGSPRYLGAAELVCRGAWRAGAGLVTLVSAERYPGAWPETIVVPPAQGGAWPPEGLSTKAADAVVVGPGLDPTDPAAAELLGAVVDWAPERLVLDAGALAPQVITPNLAALHRLGERGVEVVVTPHHGEAARFLASLDVEVDVRDDPLGAAMRLALATAAVVVLKGATTVVAASDGREAVSTAGHPGMASGGTGDVLAGVVGALLAAPGGDAFERACAAVMLHGMAGERAAQAKGVGLVASDVAEAVAAVRAELRP